MRPQNLISSLIGGLPVAKCINGALDEAQVRMTREKWISLVAHWIEFSKKNPDVELEAFALDRGINPEIFATHITRHRKQAESWIRTREAQDAFRDRRYQSYKLARRLLGKTGRKPNPLKAHKWIEITARWLSAKEADPLLKKGEFASREGVSPTAFSSASVKYDVEARAYRYLTGMGVEPVPPMSYGEVKQRRAGIERAARPPTTRPPLTAKPKEELPPARKRLSDSDWIDIIAEFFVRKANDPTLKAGDFAKDWGFSAGALSANIKKYGDRAKQIALRQMPEIPTGANLTFLEPRKQVAAAKWLTHVVDFKVQKWDRKRKHEKRLTVRDYTNEKKLDHSRFLIWAHTLSKVSTDVANKLTTEIRRKEQEEIDQTRAKMAAEAKREAELRAAMSGEVEVDPSYEPSYVRKLSNEDWREAAKDLKNVGLHVMHGAPQLHPLMVKKWMPKMKLSASVSDKVRRKLTNKWLTLGLKQTGLWNPPAQPPTKDHTQIARTLESELYAIADDVADDFGTYTERLLRGSQKRTALKYRQVFILKAKEQGFTDDRLGSFLGMPADEVAKLALRSDLETVAEQPTKRKERRVAKVRPLSGWELSRKPRVALLGIVSDAQIPKWIKDSFDVAAFRGGVSNVKASYFDIDRIGKKFRSPGPPDLLITVDRGLLLPFRGKFAPNLSELKATAFRRGIPVISAHTTTTNISGAIQSQAGSMDIPWFLDARQRTIGDSLDLDVIISLLLEGLSIEEALV
jgi:hypothetical protein